MNGAEALIETLANGGVDVVFANPGTSEMQIVAALDRHPKMRAVLGLFEGVVTGAADGYGRMAGKPAATLLHLGPGLGNGLANLHNARRAGSPIINIVGDHASYHLKFDAPLTSDVNSIAGSVSDWVRRSRSAADLSAAGAEAIAISKSFPRRVATIIAAADHAWADGAVAPASLPPTNASKVSDQVINDTVRAIQSCKTSVLYLGGGALCEHALEQAGRIAAACGARIICETFPARLQRGEGRVAVQRLPYFAEAAHQFIQDFDLVICIGTKSPVAFFAYPDKPSEIKPEGVKFIELASVFDDALDALSRLGNAIPKASAPLALQERTTPTVSNDTLDPTSIGAVLSDLMPEDAIVSDEAATASTALFSMTQGAQKHDWLTLTGGAIGQGLPVAVGAAVFHPERKVIALQADGGGMYTVQSLWTMAREKQNITTIILNNRAYAILKIELARVGVRNPGQKANSMLDLTEPEIDWVSLSHGMGVPAVRVKSVSEFHSALRKAIAADGPYLIDAFITL